MSRAIVLRRIAIKNILSHENTVLEFKPGLTAIVGPNGAGKSTIVDSIVYALLSSGKLVLRGSSKRDLIRRGASRGEIELEFEVGGHRYLVRRVIDADRPEQAWLYQLDGGKTKCLATGPSEVSNEIMRILGVPSPDAVRYTIISRQDELTKIIDLRPSERKEFILKLLGLEELEKAREALNEVVKKLRLDVGRLEAEKLELERARKELKELSSRIEKARKRIDELKSRLEDAKKELERLYTVKDLVYEYERLRDLASRIALIEEMDREITYIEDVIKKYRGVETLPVDELSTKLAEEDDARSRVASLREQLETVSRAIEKAKAILSKLGAEECSHLDDVRALYQCIRSKLENMVAEFSRIEAEIKIAKESLKIVFTSSRCPVCGREMDEDLKRSVAENLATRANELEKRLSELNERINTLRKLVEKLDTLSTRYSEIVSRIQEHVSKLEDIRRILAKDLAIARALCREITVSKDFPECMEKTVDDKTCVKMLLCIRSKVVELRGKLEQLISSRRRLYEEISSYGLDIETIKSKVTLLEGRLRALGIDPTTVSSRNIDEKIKAAQDEVSRLSEEIAKLVREIEVLEERRSKLVKDIEERSKRIEELEHRRRVLYLLEVVEKSVLGKNGVLAKLLTETARRVVEYYANEVLKALGLDLALEITSDFDIKVRSSLGELNVKSVSGGERTAIATALRIALAYAIMGRVPSFFILDEPTAHLDADRRRTLFEMIRRLAGYLPQVIVVTHDIEVLDIADHVIEVMKEGTRSIARYVT